MTDSFAEVGRRANPKVPTLRGRTVATLFFEDSTRTRMSFETAAKRMSADVLSFAAGSSSVKKGESLRDTIETIQAIGMDAVIIRHRSSGVPARVADWVDGCAVVNAGDGWHQHPTQALLDLYTVRQSLGGGDEGTDAFRGPAGHHRRRHPPQPGGPVPDHRVRRPRRRGHPGGAGHPAAALARGLAGRRRRHDLDRVLATSDVVSLLRLQAERGSGDYVPTMREYSAGYALTARRALQLPPDAIILHPGPMVRGVEIASEVAELPSARITDQVGNGVAVRMAVLFLLLGQGPLGRE